MKKIFLFSFITFISAEYFQIDSLMIGGIERKYFVSNPDGFIPTPTPLIINMHGLNMTPDQQMQMTGFDIWGVDYSQITLVYPEGMLNNNGQTSWNVGTYWDQNNYDDIGFISAMIDSIADDYNIDLDRVYACGFSNGGYMAYELSCELSDKIAAFGSVSGNFMLNDDQSCNNNREIPIMHIHGTHDEVVSYYSPSFDTSLTVIESMNYWINFNNLTNLDSTNLGYGGLGNVWHYTANNEISNTKFEHYKYENMWHYWMWFPDYPPLYSLGPNDGSFFNSTSELINFS